MPVQYYCSHCQKRLSISRKKIGELVSCPICNEVTEIPTEDQAHIPQPEAPSPSLSVHFASADPSPAPSTPEIPDASQEVSAVPQSSEVVDDTNVFFGITSVANSLESAPLQFRRERGESEEMDLTPMVDVTFLLLIFFMITASFTLEKTIPTPVPDPNEQSAAQPIQPEDDLLEKSIQIEITAENSIRLDDIELADPQLLRDELTTSMQRDQKAEALVKVADAAHQETVVFVLDTANEVGMQKIRLAAGPDD